MQPNDKPITMLPPGMYLDPQLSDDWSDDDIAKLVGPENSDKSAAEETSASDAGSGGKELDQA
jgi:hypothetical protein